MKPGLNESLLADDDEVIATVREIEAEIDAGQRMAIEDVAGRLGCTVETLLALGQEEATRRHAEYKLSQSTLTQEDFEARLAVIGAAMRHGQDYGIDEIAHHLGVQADHLEAIALQLFGPAKH